MLSLKYDRAPFSNVFTLDSVNFQMYIYALSIKTLSVFDRCHVDDRRKRIEKYARFQTKPDACGRALGPINGPQTPP